MPRPLPFIVCEPLATPVTCEHVYIRVAPCARESHKAGHNRPASACWAFNDMDKRRFQFILIGRIPYAGLLRLRFQPLQDRRETFLDKSEWISHCLSHPPVLGMYRTL